MDLEMTELGERMDNVSEQLVISLVRSVHELQRSELGYMQSAEDREHLSSREQR